MAEASPWSSSLEKKLIAAVALALAGFQLATALWGSLPPMNQRFVHLAGALLLGLLAIPTARQRRDRSKLWAVLDTVLVLLTIPLLAYFYSRLAPELVLDRGIWGVSGPERWAGLLLALLVLEVTRRAVGWPLVVVAGLALAYGLLGPYLPASIAHKGQSMWDLVDYLLWTTEGVFGVPLSVSSTYVAVFIIFGALLEKLGGATFFLELATALAGSKRGGPAQVSVVSSAMMGTISGSAVANVMTTGAFTIPLMKRLGYPSTVAGAIEAVASTGGQILPPVMGAAAFVMAEMLEIRYWQVALVAALPAVLYYVSLGVQVYLMAARLGLKGLPKEELPRPGAVLRRGWYLLAPLALLIYLLLGLHYSPTRAGVYSAGALVAVTVAASLAKEHRIPWREMLDALVSSARTMVLVAAACATAGIVIGVISLTALGVRFSQGIIALGQGQLWLTLLLTMGACIVLGMGLPTTAAYVITAVLGAPALMKLGVPPIAAHLFVLYYASLSFITPPVALAAYAGAGLAGSNAMATGFTAWRLGLAGFVVPFMFVYSPALLLQGPVGEVLLAIPTALVGIMLLAVAVEGWLGSRLTLLQRVAMLAAALLLVDPGWLTDLLGGTIAASVVGWQRYGRVWLHKARGTGRVATGTGGAGPHA